jgi:glycosyltransferase involved in cell wall biosynthesis
MTKNVLFAHQSAELYGSDKVLLSLVEGLKGTAYNPIVLLPMEGPLKFELEKLGIECHVIPLAKVGRGIFSPKGMISLLFQLAKGLREINRVVGGRNIDVVYSNTLAVLVAAVWARIKKIPHLWHVHELVVSPVVVRKGFPWLLRLFADKIICNSSMTRKWVVDEQPKLENKTVTIWNGIGLYPEKDQQAVDVFLRKLGIPVGRLVFALVGRINRWKGQGLIVDAVSILWARGYRDIHLLMAGGPPPGQDFFLQQLNEKVLDSPACSNISVIDFMPNIWCVWDCCDIAVVPSTEPEPFGLVAIEAMASGKPVVAAGHGGLLDIIDDGVTGLLFEPGNAEALADSLLYLIENPVLRASMGRMGRERQTSLFSLSTQIRATIDYLDMLTGK